jgi:hypothetical protein
MFVQFYRWLITGNALCFFNKSNFNLPKGQPEAINENTDKTIAKQSKKTQNDLQNTTRKTKY